MADKFDIISYLGSLVTYPIPEKAIMRIAQERGVMTCADWTDLSRRDRNLCLADILMLMFTAPNNTGTKTKSHGDQTITVGGIQLYNKSELYSLMMSLYRKPDQELYEALEDVGGCQWLE